MRVGQALAARQAAYLPENTNLWHEWYEQTYGRPTEELLRPIFLDFAERGFAGNGVVFACMLARASLFSQATFKWQRLADKGLFGNTSLATLETPWPNADTGELLTRMIQDSDLAGNAFIRKDTDRLVRLRPDWTDIVRVWVDASETGQPRSRWDVLGYAHHVNGPGTEAEFYDVTDVSHWSPMTDPVADFRGMSWLTPVVREINSDLAMSEYKRRFMDNNATPNLLVKYQQKLTPEARDKVSAIWNARYGGSDGLKTAIVDQGADVTMIGSAFSAIDFKNVQAAGETRIASAAGVPPLIAGLSEGLETANFAVFVQTMRRFSDLTMRPLWKSACASLAKLIDPQPGARLWYDTTDIAVLQAGEQEKATVTQTQSATISALLAAGFTADSVIEAVSANDLTLLEHTGLLSVQLQPPGSTFPPADGAHPQPAAPLTPPKPTLKEILV